MDIRVILMLAAVGAFSLILLYKEGLLKKPAPIVAAVVLTALALVLRALVFGYETLDYQNFLTRWVDFFRQRGGWRALSEPVGNYNIPYLYFMALFSYSSVKDLYLIKLLSTVFDVLLAYSAMRLVSRWQKSVWLRLGCFFTVLLWPTVFLNSAVWAQCDSIYVALALLGIDLALDDRPVLAMTCMALSFGFKLQAVFILPVCAVLWMQGKFRWYHFLVFPSVYVLLVLPAVIIGRPFMDTVLLYFGQTGSIGTGLNYNSPSVFALIRNVADTDAASKAGIVGAFAYMLAVLGVCFIGHRRLNDQAVFAAAVLLAVGIPFLLPHMHDRYFYAADILTLALAFAFPVYSPAALLTEFASLLGYHAYLKMRYLLPMRYGAAALLVVLAVGICFLADSLAGKNGQNEQKRKIRA